MKMTEKSIGQALLPIRLNRQVPVLSFFIVSGCRGRNDDYPLAVDWSKSRHAVPEELATRAATFIRFFSCIL
jgi:hypothetical protein